MATKRPAGDDVPLPQAKKPLIGLPPLHVPAATSQEDLEIKVLQVGGLVNGRDLIFLAPPLLFFNFVLFL